MRRSPRHRPGPASMNIENLPPLDKSCEEAIPGGSDVSDQMEEEDGRDQEQEAIFIDFAQPNDAREDLPPVDEVPRQEIDANRGGDADGNVEQPQVADQEVLAENRREVAD